MRRYIQRLAMLAWPDSTSPNRPAQLTILFTDDHAMPQYKEKCFGIRQQTDVVTQTYAAIPGLTLPTVECIVNAEQALREGSRRKDGPARELALYIAHGLDHAAGYDDSTPVTRRDMRNRENRWLRLTREYWMEILRP